MALHLIMIAPEFAPCAWRVMSGKTLMPDPTILTLLDAAHSALDADPENEVLRLRFFERLADGEMFLLLEAEPEGDTITPKVFDLDTGPMALVFDREERLAAFSGGIAPYAALPGRVVARMLAGQGIGLGVNLGVEVSQMLLPPEALEWLAETLDNEPDQTEAVPEQFHNPKDIPQVFLTGLDAKLARMAGLAVAVLLAGVTYRGGKRGHMLAFLGAMPGAEVPLARAVSEALVFSGLEAAEIDVTFLHAADPAAVRMGRVALRFDLPQVDRAVQTPGSAPGMDPRRPPRLV
jgi:hypothetical protein